MLEELRRYRNFGTPNYFFELLSTLKGKPNATYTRNDIDKLFFNRVIDGRSIFDGCLEIAIKTEILVVENDFLTLSNGVVDSLNSISQMRDKFVEYLFKALKDDDEFHKIFCSDYLSHDTMYKSLHINNRAFSLKYSNFKQLLIDFEAIKTHPTIELNSFIINNRYKKLFDKTVLPEIKKRKIGIEDFRKAMEQQQIYGEEAEKFVLNFEFARLNEKKEIDWVAEYIVNEGFDIASYNHEFDELPNRFIEVKSYDGTTPYFFWSRNEYSVAKLKKNDYWLYLVNRSAMNEAEYIPIMIQNPYEEILKNDENWDKQIEKYKVELICQS
ncbi:MAG: DUF3883 domain-containing protein [Bacteroidetes bacterium]|nr:DUF3883 domain-containing protein [Bacteroidota bacterium]